MNIDARSARRGAAILGFLSVLLVAVSVLLWLGMIRSNDKEISIMALMMGTSMWASTFWLWVLNRVVEHPN